MQAFVMGIKSQRKGFAALEAFFPKKKIDFLLESFDTLIV